MWEYAAGKDRPEIAEEQIAVLNLRQNVEETGRHVLDDRFGL